MEGSFGDSPEFNSGIDYLRMLTSLKMCAHEAFVDGEYDRMSKIIVTLQSALMPRILKSNKYGEKKKEKLDNKCKQIMNVIQKEEDMNKYSLFLSDWFQDILIISHTLGLDMPDKESGERAL